MSSTAYCCFIVCKAFCILSILGVRILDIITESECSTVKTQTVLRLVMLTSGLSLASISFPELPVWPLALSLCSRCKSLLFLKTTTFSSIHTDFHSSTLCWNSTAPIWSGCLSAAHPAERLSEPDPDCFGSFWEPWMLNSYKACSTSSWKTSTHQTHQATHRSDRNKKVLEGLLSSLLDLIAWSRCVGEVGAVSAVGEPPHAENIKSGWGAETGPEWGRLSGGSDQMLQVSSWWKRINTISSVMKVWLF